MIFVWRGIVIAMRAPDMFGSLVAVGITSIVGLQAIINIRGCYFVDSEYGYAVAVF